MARGTSADADTTDTNTADAGTAVEGAAAASDGNDNRFITVNVPEGDPSGLVGPQKRVDVIRALAKTGDWTRGDIAKHLTKLQNKKVPYQIVFQATRGIEGVKAAPRGENAGETAPAGDAGETVPA